MSKEYAALHDKVPGYQSWDGSCTPKSGACPFGSKRECAFGSNAGVAVSLSGKKVKYHDCPRFGGIENERTIFCRGARFFQANGEAEPNTVGAAFEE